MYVCRLLQMEELCTVTVLLQVTALVMGTNFNVTKMTEQPQPPFKCFHETSAACSGPGCTYLSAENDTAVCCKLNNFVFKEEIAGTVSFQPRFSDGFLTGNRISETDRRKQHPNKLRLTYLDESHIWMSHISG
jgi:hypothetical protein